MDFGEVVPLSGGLLHACFLRVIWVAWKRERGEANDG